MLVVKTGKNWDRFPALTVLNFTIRGSLFSSLKDHLKVFFFVFDIDNIVFEEFPWVPVIPELGRRISLCNSSEIIELLLL